MMISIVIGRPMKKTMMSISFWTNVDLLPTGINCPSPRKQSGKQNGVSEFANKFHQYNSVQKKSDVEIGNQGQ